MNLLELRGACTTLDLLALRESLSYSSIITHATCNPDDCEATADEPPDGQEEEEKECKALATSLCGRQALGIYSEFNATNKEEKCK